MKAKWNKGKWPSVDASDCFVLADGQWTNQGCSQRGMHGSIGEGFNAAGGGTYAAEWDPIAGHMRVWIWQAGQEPEDVINKRPNPELWGQPEFYFSLKDDCPPTHFKNMKLVFDITFCGDLGCPDGFSRLPCLVFTCFHIRIEKSLVNSTVCAGFRAYANSDIIQRHPRTHSHLRCTHAGIYVVIIYIIHMDSCTCSYYIHIEHAHAQTHTHTHIYIYNRHYLCDYMTFWDSWQYSIPLSFSSPGSQLSEIIVVGRASVANSGRTQAVSTWSGRNSPPLTRPTSLYRA